MISAARGSVLRTAPHSSSSRSVGTLNLARRHSRCASPSCRAPLAPSRTPLYTQTSTKLFKSGQLKPSTSGPPLPPRRSLSGGSSSPPPATLPSYRGGTLYLHRLPSTSSEEPYALSFISGPPTHPSSPTVIGYLPPGPVPDVLDARSGFEENPVFMELVHEVLRVACQDDPWISTLGKSRGTEGFVHVNDERDPPMPNRTGEPEGIIASVLIDASGAPAIDQENFYQPNDAYRIVTRDGLMMLPRTLHDRVVAGCELARQIEEDIEREATKGPE